MKIQSSFQPDDQKTAKELSQFLLVQISRSMDRFGIILDDNPFTFDGVHSVKVKKEHEDEGNKAMLPKTILRIRPPTSKGVWSAYGDSKQFPERIY